MRHGHHAIHPWAEVLDADRVAACHAVGLAVNTWTCNEPDRVSALAALHVDGVCTDVPDVALERDRANVRTPPQPELGKTSLTRVGHVGDVETARLAECVAVELIRERRVVLDPEPLDVGPDVEVRRRLHAASAECPGE